MKKILVVLLACIVLFGCAGKDGVMGPTGPAGANGATGPQGPSGPGDRITWESSTILTLRTSVPWTTIPIINAGQSATQFAFDKNSPCVYEMFYIDATGAWRPFPDNYLYIVSADPSGTGSNLGAYIYGTSTSVSLVMCNSGNNLSGYIGCKICLVKVQ